MTDVVSFALPLQETRCACVFAENPVWLVGYRYPMITTHALTSQAETYNMLKPLTWRLMTTGTKQLLPSTGKLKKSANPPFDAPAHHAAVPYMQKKGYWTAESEAWNNPRGEFDDMRVAEKAKGKSIKVDKWPAF